MTSSMLQKLLRSPESFASFPAKSDILKNIGITYKYSPTYLPLGITYEYSPIYH